MIKADLHTHSLNSKDGTCSIGELAKAAEKMGLDAIGISDHDFLSKGKKKIGKVLVLYGQEVSTKQGHVLVYGMKRQFPKGVDAQKLVLEVRKAGGITIAAHPYALRKDSVHELAEQIPFDAIEKFNGRNFTNNIRNIMEKRNGTGGSDAHCAAEVGNAYTVLNCELSEKGIIKAIKTREYSAAWKTRPHTIPIRYVMRMKKFLRIG